MKLRLIPSILIFISAYSPLSVMFAIQDFNPEWPSPFEHPAIIYTMLGLSILSIVTIALSLLKRVSTPPVKVVSVSNKSGELVSYTVPYMMSFFVLDLSNTKLLISFGFFMLIMYILTIRTHNIFINPIVAIFGYNLYDVVYVKNKLEFRSSFLSKEELKQDERYRIHEVSSGVFLATKII